MGRLSDFHGFSYITFFHLKQEHLSSPPTGRGFQVRFNKGITEGDNFLGGTFIELNPQTSANKP